MGVLVDGVEIPIQIGQVWQCRDGGKATVLRATENYTYAWWCRWSNGGEGMVTHKGKFFAVEPHHYDFIRLLSGPGSEAPTQPSEKCVYCERPLETQIVTICPTVDCEYNRGDQPSPTQPGVTAAAREIERLNNLLRNIHHSMGQALIPGNDWRREVTLSRGLAALTWAQAPTQPDVKIEQLVAALTPLADAYDRLPVLPAKIQVTLTAAELKAAHVAVQAHRAALSGEPQAPTQGAPAVAAPQGEAERLREALKAASNSLNTIAEKAGRAELLTDLVQIRGYARSRCTVARAALGGDR